MKIFRKLWEIFGDIIIQNEENFPVKSRKLVEKFLNRCQKTI